MGDIERGASLSYGGVAMKAPALPLWRLSRVRYERMVDAGILTSDDKVELLDGLLIAREPQGSRHALAVGLVRAALERACGRRYHLREEKPVALDRLSEPEPDVAVIPGRLRDYAAGHPRRPVLVVEVAESSLARDRVRKGALYARAGLAEYWVVNLTDDMLEVYRDPQRAPSAPGGHKYASVRLLKRIATVAPLVRPRSRIRVASLLP